MSNYKLIYPSLRPCRSETEISHLFERHAKVLLNEKRKMLDEIIEWETNLTRQIRENVNQQKDQLERVYKNQLEYLQIKRQEYVDTALIYEERMDREEVRQLLEQCHALKYQLGSLEYLEQPTLFIQVQQDKQQQQSSDSKKSMINEDFTTSSQQIPATTTSANNDIIVDKCPACSMIFPSTMGTNERSQHVNRHFGD